MWLGDCGQEVYLKNFDFSNQSFGCLKFSLQQQYILYIYAGFDFISALSGQEWL